MEEGKEGGRVNCSVNYIGSLKYHKKVLSFVGDFCQILIGLYNINSVQTLQQIVYFKQG